MKLAMTISMTTPMLKRTLTMMVITLLAAQSPAQAQQLADYQGDIESGRLVFGQCRTCHYPELFIGHHNGPNLHAIFGKVAGKQEGFDDYSEAFKQAEFVWTPELLFAWLADVDAMFPETTMMSLGVPDPQQRADLIVYLQQYK